MLVAGFPAGPPGTNCWVVAPGPGEQCIVLDPGIGAAPELDELLERHRLHPVAVVLTHGHFDHTFSVLPVCAANDVPAYIHPADRHQLADPWSGLGMPPGTPLFGQLTFGEPDDVRELVDGETLRLAGVELTVRLAPGHTPGSVVFGLVTPDAPLLFSGDLLFAGSVGRVDLPGGSAPAMLESLARVVLPLSDATIVHPGHGPSTTVGRERQTNPYLHQVMEMSAAGGPADPSTAAAGARARRTGL
ncbi:MAG TPA: MBL fold metallo-hydrolase [Cryptosporangiaceae bacterium]|nr:MBL fold metallo-hydrolase [Cryptosporangiaceae bacterium]